MIDKKTENSINSLIKILKKEKLSSLKVSNKGSSIEITKENNSNINYTKESNQIINKSENIIVEKEATITNEVINSPMVGVVYLTPKPNSPPFVKKGTKIKKGSTICLIEAMKTFNEIKADKDGIILKVLIKSGDAVEFGQPLIELK